MKYSNVTNKMKKKSVKGLLAVVALVIILMIASTFSEPEFVLQYVLQGELKTEVFDNTDEMMSRAQELEQMGVTYYINN